MSVFLLPWLPRPPPDFRKRCRSISTDDAIGLRALANHALDENQLNVLAKTVDRCREAGSPAKELISLRLALLGNGTTSFMVAALKASALRYGLLLEVIEAPYDMAFQTAIDPESEINRAAPEFALIAFDQNLLQWPKDASSASEAATTVDTAIAHLETIVAGIAENCGASTIFQTLPGPHMHLIGNFDARLPASPRSITQKFNRHLLKLADQTESLVLDVATLSETVGLDTWHDPMLWNMAKVGFAPAMLPYYADHVGRLLGAAKGRSRKCLVLDLDNTLWGGVIGDDGLDGILLGQGDPTGEAHLEIQRTALRLRALGVVLAVSSKNEDATARLPFQKHPDMLLKESDIAVFQANWQDKASNLEAIASILDLGLDSLVLLDDNPAERAQVRSALPQVAVPELPQDPSSFAPILLAAGYFETVSVSKEDLLRADDYGARAKRIELQQSTRDLTSFLKSLEMEISFAPFDTVGRPRIVQLINKSNQFNLTTHRYATTDIAKMEDDPLIHTFQIRLRDRFGDNGMVSVVICRESSDIWEIDTWLMSCRVLGRGVEQAVLNEIARQAEEHGATELLGQYIPSGRNELVRDHYEKLGFEASGDAWRLNLEGYCPATVQMNIDRPAPVEIG